MPINKLLYPPTQNGLQKTLGSALDAGVTASATLNNTTGIDNKPGVCVVDRIDTTGAAKPASDREYIIYTGTSGATLTGLTRGQGGSTDQDHGVGAIVEFVADVNVFLEIITALATVVDPAATGTLNSAIATLTGTQELSNKTHDGDLKLKNATDNIQVNGADPYRTIVLPATAFSPTTTAGCASAATVETTTNKVNYKVLDFDKATEEHAFTNFCMPNNWDGGTILVKFEWTSTAATGDVMWGIEGRAFANDDAADQALGTAVTVTDTITAANDFDFSAETTAVTLAGTPAGGQSVYLQVFRKAADAADTLDADARLKSVSIRYKVGQYSD
jgi:hypothetical protein